MNILIVCANRSAYPLPVLPAGACIVAEAAEKAGHSVRLLDLMFASAPLREIHVALRSARFDIIGFSVRNIDNIDIGEPHCFIDDLLPLIDAVRTVTDAPIVLGGASIMVMPEEILRATRVSVASVGDGEVVFPRLVDCLGRGETGKDLPGVVVLQDGLFRANPPEHGTSGTDCAAPDYTRWLDMKAYTRHFASIPIQTKLGCRFKCIYCTYCNIEGSSYRLKDPESVARAALTYAAQGFRDIEFVDNVFNAPYDHAMAVCEALIRARPRATFQSLDLNPVHFDHELVSAMERAGFSGIGLTVESASDPVLQGLRKGFTAREVHRAAEIVRVHDLPCFWIFMLGGPGETQETVKETLQFAEKSIRPGDAAFFSVGIRIYPGTELEEIARRQGLLSLPPDRMLEPVYYASPEVDTTWIAGKVKESMSGHMNFMDSYSLSFPYLPQIRQFGHWLGLKTPLWQYTRRIRRGLRMIGMDV